MRILEGKSFPNPAHLSASGWGDEALANISAISGLLGVVSGTFNVQLDKEYENKWDWELPVKQFVSGESLFIQRCKIDKRRALIVRPSSHLTVPVSTDKAQGFDVLEIMAPVNEQKMLKNNLHQPCSKHQKGNPG
jgi:hypothetical protein